jgi:hypothetical protein
MMIFENYFSMRVLLRMTIRICLLIFAVTQISYAETFVVDPSTTGRKKDGQGYRMISLLEACHMARKTPNGPHRVIMKAGDYYLEKPLSLDAKDSGLTIEAQSGGDVTLYGGRLLSGWQPEKDYLWYKELKGVKEGTWDFRTLVVNERLAERACFPGSGKFNNLAVSNLRLLPGVAGFWDRKPTHDELVIMPYDSKDIPPSLDVRNAEVRLYHMWTESLVGVAMNDIKRQVLILSGEPDWPPGALNQRKYVILNTREGMVRPGQWYLDRTLGRVYYWPLPGEDMSRIKIVAPTTGSVIRIAGGSKEKVEMITLRGLRIEATTPPLKPSGFGGWGFDGALSVNNARRCSFESLEVCNVGGVGISGTNLTDSEIKKCRVHDIGACGVRFSYFENMNFTENHVFHTGVYYPGSSACAFDGKRVHIQLNDIHNAPYSGLICNGKDHLIEKNLIYNVMKEMHDGAAIFGHMQDSLIRKNMVRDVKQVGEGFGVAAYYLDEGSRECVVEENVSIGVQRPVHNHIARGITVKENVFIAEKDMTISFLNSSECTFEKNTLYVPGKLNVNFPDGIKIWKENVVFQGSPEKNRM